MCKECDIIQALFTAASKSPRNNYYPTLKFLVALEKQKRILLYAGDCTLSDAIKVLETEQHYTVCHYYKCIGCSQVFFFGACIRGTPIYKMIDDAEDVNYRNMIWEYWLKV